MNAPNETKHTPGPWEALHGSVGKKGEGLKTSGLGVWGSNLHLQPGYGPDNCIGFIAPDNHITETDLANAKLIAAAPELFAAAQDFIDKVDSGRARSTDSYAKFKAAIAKATGGAHV